MNHEQHQKIDEIVFNGNSYPEIHQWLDEFFKPYNGQNNPIEHWTKRHYGKAISKKYGIATLEYTVAYLHILCDIIDKFQVIYMPIDEEQVKDFLSIK